MISTISTPFVDTRAGDLVLSLTEPSLSAAAVRTIPLKGGHVELRLLKASHQVVVRRGGHELIETLACLPSGSATLPAHYRTQCAIGAYGTSVSVRRLAPTEFARRVGDLLARYADDERYVIGRYPGDPLATTGVGLAESTPGALRWRSWHAYPQERRLVLTDSALRMHTADRATERAGRVTEAAGRVAESVGRVAEGVAR